MSKYVSKLLKLFLPIVLLGSFSYVYSVEAATSFSIEVVQPCNINYGGDRCSSELKLANNVGEALDGTAFFDVDYNGICGDSFEVGGIDVWYDNQAPKMEWSGDRFVFSGFEIIEGETQPKLKIETASNLCPGNYTLTLTLKGTAETGEEYTTTPTIIGGGGGYYTPPTPTTPTTDTGEVTATPGEGGVTTLFNSDGSGIELIVPEGAVSGNTVFTIKTVDINSINQPSPESGLFLINGLAYEIKAEVDGEFITTFDNPLTLTFTYTEDQIEGIEEDSLKIYWWDGKDWVVLGNSEVDRDDNTVTASINHFTLFALLGEEEDIIPEGKTEEGMGEETEEGEIISGEEIISEESEEEAVIEEGEPQEGEAKVVQETDDRRGWLAAIGVIPLNLKVLLGIAIVVIIGLIVLKVTRMRRKTQ